MTEDPPLNIWGTVTASVPVEAVKFEPLESGGYLVLTHEDGTEFDVWLESHAEVVAESKRLKAHWPDEIRHLWSFSRSDSGTGEGMRRWLSTEIGALTGCSIQGGLRALHSALAVLEAPTAASAVLVQHLKTSLLEKNRQSKCEEIASELAAAAWLLQRGVLSEPPCRCELGVDPILDLGLTWKDQLVGVEVKHNDNRSQTLWMDGTSSRHGIREIVEEVFGSDVTVSLEWPGGTPSPRLVGQATVPAARKLKGKLEGWKREHGDIPQGQRMTVVTTMTFEPGHQQVLARVVVARDLQVSMTMTWGGDGWGHTVDQVVDHSSKKAEKLVRSEGRVPPFILLYRCPPGGHAVYTPEKLVWAWQEELSGGGDIPKELVGVVLLGHHHDDPSVHTAFGVWRPGWEELGPHLDIREPPGTELSTTAEKLWTEMLGDIQNALTGTRDLPQRDDLVRASSELSQHRTDSPTAERVFANAWIAMATNGFKSRASQFLSVGSLPFPCPGERVIRKERPRPSR